MGKALAPKIIRENREIIASYAEVGVRKGATLIPVAETLRPGSTVWFFDYENVVNRLHTKLMSRDDLDLYYKPMPNTTKIRDSYVWSLLQLVAKTKGAPVFDYVYLDGSHTFDVDCGALLLIDQLLREGGWIEFDDYSWTLAKSPTASKRRKAQFTEDQVRSPHIKLLVDNVVRHNRNYVEVVNNRVFQKISAD